MLKEAQESKTMQTTRRCEAMYYKDNPETKRRKNAERRTVGGRQVYLSSPLHPANATTVKEPPAFADLPPYEVGANDGKGKGKSKSRSRKNAVKFRKYVLARDRRCVVTGTPVDAVVTSKGRTHTMVQAAHIKPYKMCRPGEYDDLDNGIAMRVDIHAAFDAALFTISDEGYIMPSPRVSQWNSSKVVGSLTAGQRRYLEGHRKWAQENWTRWAR